MNMQTTKHGMMVMVALVGAVIGCTTRAGKGAAVGGVSGAVLGAGAGAAAGGSKGAVIGAGVGAAAGAGAGALIGRYMDRQAAAVRKDVGSADVVREGDKLVVRFNSQILFDTESAVLRSSAKHDLAEFARVLKQYPDTNVLVEGHTDSTGPRGYNEQLSWKRAESVINFLEREGVAHDRLAGQGLGERAPVASNTTAYGRAENRRVEVEIAANDQLRKRAAQQARARTALR
jgi:outer membrane protein OmpA-like peptidoglycan-associated protein